MKWLRRTFILALLLCAIPAVLWFWLLHTHSGAKWALQRAVGATDQALAVGIVQGDFGSGVVINDLSWNAAGTSISAQQLDVVVDVDLLPLAVELSAARIQTLDVKLAAEEAGDQGSLDIAALVGQLRLPLPVTIVDLQLRQGNIGRGEDSIAQIDQLNLDARWFEQIRIDRLELSAMDYVASASGMLALTGKNDANFNISVSAADNASFRSLDASAKVDGDLQGYTLITTANFELHDLSPHAVAIEGTGNLGSIRIQTLTLDGTTARLQGSAELVWEDERSFEADVSVQHFSLHELVDSWPAKHTLSGDLQFRYANGRLEVPAATVAAANSDVTLQTSGVMNLVSGEIDSSLKWRDFSWPLDGSDDLLRSRTGDVVLSGSLQAWRVAGDVSLQTPQSPEGAFSIAGQGDLDSADVEIRDGQILGGEVSGRTTVRWRDSIPWTADLNVSNIATAELLQEWPGRVSGSVRASGESANQSLQVQLRDVRGVLRDLPFSADGDLQLADSIVSAQNLQLRHGDSFATLNGSPKQPNGLAFELYVSELNRYLEDVEGAVDASGRASEFGEQPQLRIDLDSESLRIGAVQIDNLQVRNRDNPDAIADVLLSAQRIGTAGEGVQEVVAQLEIEKDRQFLSASMRRFESDLTVALEGGFSDPQQPFVSQWLGQLTKLELDLNSPSSLQLSAPADIGYGPSNAQLKAFCVATASGASFCSDATWSGANNFDISMQISDLPLNTLQSIVDTEVEFDQLISGKLAWRSNPRGASGSGALTLTPGTLTSKLQPDFSLQTGVGDIDFSITDGKLLAGSLDLPMPGSGHIAGEFSLLDVANPATSGVTGKLDIALNDLSGLAYFSKLIDSSGGQLSVNVALAGSVAQPVLAGTAALRRGLLEYEPIGLRLDELELQLAMSDEQQIEIDGTFLAGAGRGELKSTVEYGDARPASVKMTIDGERLTLVDLPDVRAVADPNITLAYSANRLDLGGILLVRDATVRPRNLGESPVPESDDVVIVAGELPDTVIDTADEGKLEIFGDLTVTLADNVSIDLDLAQATVTGSTKFTWDGDVIPMADGRYDVQGQIQAFGQVLEITEGGVRFANVPANDPQLRLIAERDIFGNTQVKRAGVFVDGNVNRPSIKAFTVPRTTEERALTLLVTGSDFDYEQGVGAVDFGTYIAPRLFVSYGVGIFDRDNVISARYDLSKKFGIKASSGAKESGVDLNYRFEN